MDAYDEMTDAYIRKVYELKNKSKEISQHDLAERLVEDINKANSVETTVTLRKRYDNWAKTYNAYLQKHKNQLEKLGEPYASMKERAEIIK
jgi:flagellar motility protein MotE (MotC chaperone)